MAEPIIVASGVYKSFKLPHEKSTGLKQALINFRFGKRYDQQQVLSDISFEIKEGEFFGIVGRNGSGKSTLLKILAQIYVPEKGHVRINGTLTPFIELGVGFNPELTGRENVYLNGALLGFDRNDVTVMYDDIVAFAEIEEFMDQKLKNYSSGMQVRLAFSISIRAKSDILLVDEVLAVGDAAFQKKCFDYFYELKQRGTTVVFISHDRSSLERFCDRGILIHEGKITAAGPIKKVLSHYNQVVLEEMQDNTDDEDTSGQASDRNTEYAQIQNVATYSSRNKAETKFMYGDKINVRFDAAIKQDITNPILGITIWQKNVNQPIYATNTVIGEVTTGSFKVGQSIQFAVTLPSMLNDGEYYVEPAIANNTGTVYYDVIPKAHHFIISGSVNPYSIIHVPEKITLTKT